MKLVLAAVAALAVLAPAAQAASWRQVAPSQRADVARTADGALHVAWAAGGTLFHTTAGTLETRPIAAGATEADPALLAVGHGLRAFWGPVSAFSPDGASWLLEPAGPATGEVSAAALPDGTTLRAWADGRVFVNGFDYGAGAFPALAPGMLAWSVGEAVHVQAVNADGSPAGAVMAMPESGGRPSIVAVRDGFVVASGERVWRVGSRSTLRLERARGTTLSADSRGRVWAAWIEGDRVLAARSNRDVTEFGAPVDLGALRGVETLDVSAATRAAHVLGGAGGTSSLKRTLPGLTLAERHRRTSFTFSVTDAGDPVRGAKVTVGARSARTDRNGRVKLKVTNRKLVARATMTGYETAKLRLPR